MKRKIKDFIINIIIIVVVFVIWCCFDELRYDNRQSKSMESDMKYDGYLCLFGDESVDIEEEQQIIEIMYPGDKKGVNFVYDNTAYEDTENYEGLRYEGKDESYNYTKVEFKVTSYDYSLAYKNGVEALNKYIKENKNASKEDKERYFAERLQYEGKNIKNSDKRRISYIYRKKRPMLTVGSGYSHVDLLPWQKDDMDLANAVTGGLVEEMDKTKLPKGINLEDTLKRVDREYEQERFI